LNTSTPEPAAPAEASLQAAGLTYRVVRHGPVSSLNEASLVRGIRACDIVKTLVVRRAEDDYVFVLLPGDREISWPKLRTLLGVNRLSLPDAEAAYRATGYRRGTITPFGSTQAWPVIADAAIEPGQISMGAGEPGAAVSVESQAALVALNAQIADISNQPRRGHQPA
jgi:Cys-tRNA(Pro)/Cys-tRNA(Cys) deacylase